MSKKIKNIFIKLSSNPVRVIKGRLGYHTNIKDIYVNNNTNYNTFLSMYILDSDQKKTFICNNIIIPPNKRFEIPYDGNIEIENKEYIFAETKKPTDLDIFCNYIETEKIINSIDVLFRNHDGITITSGINWSVVNSNDGKKVIKFSENAQYSAIPDITYEIIGQKVIVYKTANLKPPVCDFEEFPDRYEINIYANKTNVPFSGFLTKSFINISFNIDGFWRYNTENTFSDLNVWNTSNTEIAANPDTYYLNFKDIDNYTKPSDFSIKTLSNNLIDLNLKYITNNGTLKVTTDYEVDNIIWRLIDGFGGEDLSDDYYLNSLVVLEEGTHTIKIDAIDGIFAEQEYQIFINKNQEHYIKHNLIPVNAQLQVELNDIDATDVWQISTTDNFENNNIWYSTTDTIDIDEGLYYINFGNVDNYITPSVIQIQVSENMKTLVTSEYLPITGSITILKPSLLEESVAQGIKWRIINNITQEKTNWFVYNITHLINEGEYDIEFQDIEDHFKSFTASIIVYSNQKTTYVMNNTILL